jgi:hypothetical protein
VTRARRLALATLALAAFIGGCGSADSETPPPYGDAPDATMDADSADASLPTDAKAPPYDAADGAHLDRNTPVVDASPDALAPDSGAVADAASDAAHAADAAPPLPPPPVPAIGAQIDRAGRPGINLLLTNPFDLSVPTGSRDATEDAYNAASDPSQWDALFEEDIAINLAILDGFDRSCGNQLHIGPPGVTRYRGLAKMLTDDRLYLDVRKPQCGTYLALEIAAPAEATTCGGLTPLSTSIDASYGLFMTGDATSPFVNGIDLDADGTASATVFPFLSPPN